MINAPTTVDEYNAITKTIQHYIDQRWLGGTLTNFATIRKRINRMKELEEIVAAEDSALTKKERKALGRVYRQELVKRSALKRIAAAWVITVPASALISAMLLFTIRGMMLP